jgi:hypothetical protein
VYDRYLAEIQVAWAYSFNDVQSFLFSLLDIRTEFFVLASLPTLTPVKPLLLVSFLLSAAYILIPMQTTRAKEEAPEVANPLSEAAQPVRIPTSDEIVEDQAFYVNLCDEQSGQNVDEFKRVRSLKLNIGSSLKARSKSGNQTSTRRQRCVCC